LDQVRHAYHHSTVVVNKSLPTDVLQEYLYHLRHAFGQKIDHLQILNTILVLLLYLE